MNHVTHGISSTALNLALHFMESNPEENIPKVVDTLLNFIKDEGNRSKLIAAKNVMKEKDNPYRNLILRGFEELQPIVRKRFLSNFVLNASMLRTKRAQVLMDQYDCNIPWAILMDPTSACNLSCIGCWAGEYKKTDSLDYTLMDRIIREGKEMGTYFYIYSGGEPTLRKKDLLKLAAKHDDCMFLAFTNGTLVDREFSQSLADLGNFALAFSIEGFEEQTDLRRGSGTYSKVLEGMRHMREAKAPFGFSTCYHSKNVDGVGSEDFLDFLVEQGCMFGWYFTYIPLGKNADTTLMTKADQREFMAHWLRDMRTKKSIFLLDFWNDAQYVGGCIAGGRSYLHINAAGDVEPCAFIHYANTNIRNSTLLDALQSPLFMEYRKHQPFNKNLFQPCPLLDNPEALAQMVKDSGASSTQPLDHEDVDELCAKCTSAAKEWESHAILLRKQYIDER
ncbi:MAG: radical SAM protein [Sphaerochaeta sp.]|jgi:MoaA/NifB/PqqE/SkfB family radical SAM enzyme|uniref:radical SAM protein n=1 Tax=Sphaerochaeta sp. TaxID=1972642 RepID=UPI003D0A7E97